MSCCSIPTAISGLDPAKNLVSPQIGQGQFIGSYMPGTNTPIQTIVGQNMQGVGALGNAITIQTDTGFISSLSTQPKNVLRLTGAFGNSYIQGSNINFSVPYSGNPGVQILPSTGTLTAYGQVVGNTFYGLNGAGTGGQAIIGQNYNATVNNTSTIRTMNMALVPINGGVNGIALRLNFYDANGNILYIRDL